ncbi:RecF/RecN/SMC protein [Martensiomyces pterosporus]|nr:RecF/RecN/SMC protein [Martensiomyces pterosporus]
MGQLIQLEVENFKSYRGHQVIGPFSSFTAVVGPNGAGKSNLMDAISFVLGVRSAHLRSSHMRDLVYRGRTVDTRNGHVIDEAGDQEGRRAWVKAVYEDDGGHTIVFQRTITGAGASEYRINNRLVSQHTYTQALENQNILVKANNFLVFQGDVEAVASQSPKDLTRMVEQISGSWDLHQQYSELEKAQDATAEASTFAYNKKRAVAAEVQTIAEQKKELELYESKLRARTKLTVQLMLYKLFIAENRIRDIKGEMGSLHGESIARAADRKGRLDASLQSQQKSQAKAYKAVNRQERQIKLVEQKIESRQPKLAGLGEKVDHTERKVKHIEDNVERAQADAARQTEAVSHLDSEYARVKDAQARFEEQWQATQSRRGGQISEATMAEYNRLSEQLRGDSVEDTHQRDALDRQIQLLAEAARRSRDKLEGLRIQREGLEVSEHACQQQLEQATAAVASVEREMQQARRDAEAAKNEHDRLVRLEIELNEKLSGVLKELSQARADQRESTREAKLKEVISALQRVFTGVHGRLSDLCKPTQHKYDAGIATVLGRHMDAIVVDSQATAIECIKYMKEQRAGQATFLPLDTLQPQQINESLRHAHRGARLATDVLQFDPSIEAAVLHACANALICDSVDIAKNVCYERKLEAKTVTLDGTVIHRSGLITGGTSSRGGNHRAQVQRWEAAAVENLRRARDRLTEELQSVARERRKLGKEEMLSSHISGLQTKHQFSRETADALARKIQGVATERAHIEAQIQENEPVAAQATAELDQAKEGRQAVNARIQEAAGPIFAAFCEEVGVASLDDFEKHLLSATEATAERRLQFTTHLSKLDSQRTFERQQLEEAADSLDRLTQSLQATKEALAGLQAELAQERQAMAGLVDQIGSLRRELGALNSKHSDATEAVQEARHSVEQGQKELDGMNRELSAKITELDRAVADKAAVLRRCKIEDIPIPLHQGSLQALALEASSTTNIGTQLTGSYASQLSIGGTQNSSGSLLESDDIVADYSQLPQQARAGIPADVEQRYQEDIDRLSTEVDALNPNPHARERLEAARARLHEIEVEHNAARQGAKEAKAQFQAVRKRRHDIFMRCYNHLSTAIDHAYKALTQSPLFPLGGTAYLALEDPDSPYLGGVKYHAMPPLKRFRDMDQLSGGEKTVAALALLFSMQTYRPAPFFVLDEVDAALDLANVTKLANYLPASAKDASFQFIVISLKQALFERAQSLVGIYRDQAQNSSQILTVDLEQFPA